MSSPPPSLPQKEFGRAAPFAAVSGSDPPKVPRSLFIDAPQPDQEGQCKLFITIKRICFHLSSRRPFPLASLHPRRTQVASLRPCRPSGHLLFQELFRVAGLCSTFSSPRGNRFVLLPLRALDDPLGEAWTYLFIYFGPLLHLVRGLEIKVTFRASGIL